MEPDEARAIADRLGGIAVSAITGDGLSELLAGAERLLWSSSTLQPRDLQLAASGG